MQKKIRKIERADSSLIELNALAVDRVIRKMAEIAKMDWELSTVLVTNESTVGDFLSDPTDVVVLAHRLGFGIKRSDLLVDVAIRLTPST